ncbi:MAG: hypothetical protein IJD65_04130, partial [Mailhella sp.]|nr:hypothetical protein [Mailhella sp.]
MKKLVSLMIALVMVFSMATVAFAADGDEVKGSITVNGITKDTTYTIYKMLDLESYAISGAYSYKVNSDWEGFFATDEAKYYMSVGADGYATWNESVSHEDDAVVAAFAKLALAYAKENDIAAVASYSANADAASYVFDDLDLGYYLVDSTAGALCGLTTTDPNASINAKNHTPTVDKQVQEDLGGKWGDTNTADIGQIVNFMSIVHVV